MMTMQQLVPHLHSGLPSIYLTTLTNPLLPPALCHPHSLPVPLTPPSLIPLCGLLEIISPAVQASAPIARVMDRSAEKRTEGAGAEQCSPPYREKNPKHLEVCCSAFTSYNQSVSLITPLLL